MLRIVPYFNIKLTFINDKYFHNFVKNKTKLHDFNSQKIKHFHYF